MKTQTIEQFFHGHLTDSRTPTRDSVQVAHLARKSQQLLAEIVVAAAAGLVLAAAIWATLSFAASGVPGAIVWASGFIFLALAVESDGDRYVPLLTTGLSLLVLAVLGSWVAVEFTIIAAVVIMGWVLHAARRLV